MPSKKDQAIAYGITRPKIVKNFYKNTKVLDNGCIVWTKSINESKYGRLCVAFKDEDNHTSYVQIYAHRFSWALNKGIETLPPGIGRLGTGDRLVINHMCHNRICVNTDHMEAIMHSKNVSPDKRKPKND
jgi:hypothetical protein